MLVSALFAPDIGRRKPRQRRQANQKAPVQSASPSEVASLPLEVLVTSQIAPPAQADGPRLVSCGMLESPANHEMGDEFAFDARRI
jgi:hypothetical protein